MNDTPALAADTEDDAGEQRKGTALDLHDFGAAEQALNDAAKRLNAVWISFVLLCVYIFIATYTVTPAVLFRDAPVKLPIFNADLPLKVYFVMAPFLILCLHAYLIVLVKGLAEKIDTYEDVLNRSANTPGRITAGRNVLHSRLDSSIIIRAMTAQYRDTRSTVDVISGVIAGLTIIVLPVGLLLLTQLIFLPYQDKWLTWTHRGFVIADVLLWLLLWPFFLTSWLAITGQLLAVGLILFASIFVATFPGEWIYTMLIGHWPHVLTVKVFEGPPDPVDYIRRGGILPFSNRLILPDDPKLAEIAGASSGGVSLSMRGRSFRKAVFDRSNLTRVDFSAADLRGASLKGTKLEGAKFECTTPAKVNPSASSAGYAEYADWRRSATGWGYIEYLEYTDCTRLDGMNLSNTSLKGASLNGAQLREVNLRMASLDSASFIGADMSGADLRESSVEGANFSGATLTGASLSFARGDAVNFSNARLTAADFGDALLKAATFHSAMLQGARFAGATLTATDFTNAHMQAVDLSSAKLLAASFERAYLQDATLDRANIKGTSFESASLRGASLECVTPFRTDFADTDLLETAVNVKKCETDWYYDTSWKNSYPMDKYDLKDDRIPAGRHSGYSYDTFYTEPYSEPVRIYEYPEKLSAEDFERQLNDVVISKLPEEAKSRVGKAFERLKPGGRTKEQDEAEKSYWATWAKRSALPESHDEALAARLESIACVAEGAPYVARGLLRAGRFGQLAGMDEKSKVHRQRIVAHLKAASDGSDDKCLGAKGLREEDFPPSDATRAR